MPFDTEAFATALRKNALPPFGAGKCARFVRLAIEAAGMKTDPHPGSAKDWGPTLERLGFQPVAGEGYEPVPGDIAVIQTTTESSDGHMQGYDGKNWSSDFVQREFWPGPSFRKEKPAFVVFRFP